MKKDRTPEALLFILWLLGFIPGLLLGILTPQTGKPNNNNMKTEESTIEWGEWECPACGDVCQDPNTIASTACHNGHGVWLTAVNENGRMEAMLQDKTSVGLKSATGK